MKTIAVVTSTRAEYGLLSLIIKNLQDKESDTFKAELIVTGTHLSEKYGLTVKEIEDDDVRIDIKIFVPVDSDNELRISHNQSVILEKFSKIFFKRKYDGLVLLGDRYEMLAVAIAAGNLGIPIFHIGGGDTTEGAIDEWCRHCITKISYMHFPSNSISYKRILQMGENPKHVFNYGSTSVDNSKKLASMSKSEALKSVGLDDCNFALCTFHPETIDKRNVIEDLKNILDATTFYKNIIFIFTKSNADNGGELINNFLELNRTDNLCVFDSLGAKRYLSLMKAAEFVLGNSSSGIIEAPLFGIPTVNIGNRQRGRLQAESILNCSISAVDIKQSIAKAIAPDFKLKCKSVKSLYGDGHSAEKISNKIYETVMFSSIDLKKKFYPI